VAEIALVRCCWSIARGVGISGECFSGNVRPLLSGKSKVLALVKFWHASGFAVLVRYPQGVRSGPFVNF